MHPHHVTLSGQAHVRAGEQLGTIDLGLRSWDEAVRLLLAAHLHATAEGQRMVETHLVRMAQIADLAQNAVALLDRLPDAATAPLGEHWTQLRGALLQHALTLSGPASPTVSPPATETQDEAQRPPLGLLAQRSGQDLPLEICYSAAGFYLGTYNDEGPYTRESQEYWPQREQAQRALDTGHWTQRSDH